jgi:hypothetical protein
MVLPSCFRFLGLIVNFDVVQNQCFGLGRCGDCDRYLRSLMDGGGLKAVLNIPTVVKRRR